MERRAILRSAPLLLAFDLLEAAETRSTVVAALDWSKAHPPASTPTDPSSKSTSMPARSLNCGRLTNQEFTTKPTRLGDGFAFSPCQMARNS